MSSIFTSEYVSAQNSTLTVSAAASLIDAFTNLAKVFEKKYPDVKINLNFAASNPLFRQIVEGAPVDVFASADQKTMDMAEKEKVVDEKSRQNFAINDLVLIVPKNSEKPKSLDELKKIKSIAIGNPDFVPAGRYAMQALEQAGLWNTLKEKYITAASVRQTLDYVSRGEVDAGIVYGTDAKQMDHKVDVALVLEGHDPVTYPIAITLTGNNRIAAAQFIELLLSPEGQSIMAKYGFAKP